MGDLADDGTRSAILAALPPSYYERGFDSVGHELRHMPGKINLDRLEEIIETRTSMLEVDPVSRPSQSPSPSSTNPSAHAFIPQLAIPNALTAAP